MDYTVEITRRVSRPFQGKRKRFDFDAPLCDIHVDGLHVGYCTPTNPPGEIRIINQDANKAVVEAVTKAVTEYYEQPINPDNIGQATPIESQQEDDELDG